MCVWRLPPPSRSPLEALPIRSSSKSSPWRPENTSSVHRQAPGVEMVVFITLPLSNLLLDGNSYGVPLGFGHIAGLLLRHLRNYRSGSSWYQVPPPMNCHPGADLIKEPFKKRPFPQFRAHGHPQAAAAGVGRPGDPCPGPGDPPRVGTATHPGVAATHPGTEIPPPPHSYPQMRGPI